MNPYRRRVEPTIHDAHDARAHVDGVLVGAFVVMWLLSVARVVLALLERHELGAEGAVAFALVVVLPFVLRRAVL